MDIATIFNYYNFMNHRELLVGIFSLIASISVGYYTYSRGLYNTLAFLKGFIGLSIIGGFGYYVFTNILKGSNAMEVYIPLVLIVAVFFYISFELVSMGIKYAFNFVLMFMILIFSLHQFGLYGMKSSIHDYTSKAYGYELTQKEQYEQTKDMDGTQLYFLKSYRYLQTLYVDGNTNVQKSIVSVLNPVGKGKRTVSEYKTAHSRENLSVLNRSIFNKSGGYAYLFGNVYKVSQIVDAFDFNRVYETTRENTPTFNGKTE